ncbi:GNAT family N-acetyltransferase [Virgibacillus halophilus]|uniref:GNAT family N-acetyltransferase n=1 Tax=Tigheibacillus halophilus TaxID=361280 RepID=A0ABU5C819_9BACI|nr:GNAT family N-acetyltransferase [Virgibacillus halophilus]
MKKPILLDFPSEFQTERLLLRLPLPGDGKVVHQAITASKNELKPWLPFAQKEQTPDETEISVRDAHIAFQQRTDLRLHIFEKATGDFIGCTGLHRINWNVPKFEIGYWVDSRKSGNYFMTEAVKGVTEFAFRELHANRVEIRCDSENDRSRAIPERLQFTLEGILHHDDIAPDESGLRDTCIYAKTKEKRIK